MEERLYAEGCRLKGEEEWEIDKYQGLGSIRDSLSCITLRFVQTQALHCLTAFSYNTMLISVHIEGTGMKSVSAAEFHNHCLQLIKEVHDTGVPLVITDNGQPVAQLGPVPDQMPTLIGAHRGKIKVLGDILEPIGEAWEASR